MKRLLVIDDDPLVLIALKTALGVMFPSGLKIETFSDARKALDRIREQHFDVVISDYRMPEMDGIAFLQSASQQQPHLVRIMLSTFADFEVVQKAINEADIFRYIVKPWQDADIFKHLQDALVLSERLQAMPAPPQ